MGSFYGSITPGTILNADIAAGAGVVATKIQHQHELTFAQPNTAATAETKVVHVVKGATGTIVAFRAGSIVAATSTGVATVNLKKNGTTVLSAVITLDNANTAYIVEEGTISVPALAAGDVLTVEVAVSSTVLPTGLFAQVVLREDA